MKRLQDCRPGPELARETREGLTDALAMLAALRGNYHMDLTKATRALEAVCAAEQVLDLADAYCARPSKRTRDALMAATARRRTS